MGTAPIEIRLGSTLDDVERELIIKTLEFTGGNKTRAAEVLGVTRRLSTIGLSATTGRSRPKLNKRREFL